MRCCNHAPNVKMLLSVVYNNDGLTSASAASVTKLFMQIRAVDRLQMRRRDQLQVSEWIHQLPFRLSRVHIILPLPHSLDDVEVDPVVGGERAERRGRGRRRRLRGQERLQEGGHRPHRRPQLEGRRGGRRQSRSVGLWNRLRDCP